MTRELASGAFSRGRVLRWLGAALFGVLTGGTALGAMAKSALGTHLGYWGLPYKRDHCTSLGFRQYSAILWNIPCGVSWWTACAHTPGNPQGIAPRPPDRCRRRLKMWGEWDVPVPSNSQDGCPHWGEYYINPEAPCTPGVVGAKTVWAHLVDVPSGVPWDFACKITPGFEHRPPDVCGYWEDGRARSYPGANNTGFWYIFAPECCVERLVGCYRCPNGGNLALKCEKTCVDESGQYVTTERVCPELGSLYQCSWLPSFPYPTSGRTYVVQWGDTLSEIAVKLGTNVDHLAELNGIMDPDVIYAGQTIYY